MNVALPALRVTAPELYPPPVKVTAPIGVGVPLTATATVSVWVVVMLVEEGVTVIAGAAFVTLKTDEVPVAPP